MAKVKKGLAPDYHTVPESRLKQLGGQASPSCMGKEGWTRGDWRDRRWTRQVSLKSQISVSDELGCYGDLGKEVKPW